MPFISLYSMLDKQVVREKSIIHLCMSTKGLKVIYGHCKIYCFHDSLLLKSFIVYLRVKFTDRELLKKIYQTITLLDACVTDVPVCYTVQITTCSLLHNWQFSSRQGSVRGSPVSGQRPTIQHQSARMGSDGVSCLQRQSSGTRVSHMYYLLCAIILLAPLVRS